MYVVSHIHKHLKYKKVNNEMFIMFSFEVEIFRGGEDFLYLLFPWLLKVLIVNSVNWQYFHVTRHIFQWQSFGFPCCLGTSLFGVKPPQIFTKLCAVYSLYPPVLSGSLCCSPRLRDVNADTEVSECCDGKANSTLGYLMLVCWGP